MTPLDASADRKPSGPVMWRGDRWLAALSHASTAAPLWALAANALLFFAYGEKSRVVCLHARQGIRFQILFLLAAGAKFLADALSVPVAVVSGSDSLRGAVDRAGRWVLAALFAVYVLCCLVGVVQSLRGRVFIYPFVGGKKLYEEYIRAGFHEP
ncbi:MAG TPA: DUF4870 domain-containing protein [Sumerlaeia bacterium]|nr:DUF4870 domain-containing protein [Sumerlaeia bacterium]